MESFNVNLGGETYTITTLKDKIDYQVAKGTEVLGSITPISGHSGIKWTGMAITNDLAQQIGELIEEHEM
ncbi:hypothetical protein WG904_03380 [Pedobacter sp. Du54]|uniref:hypothetical protein n=1 Tax=Pedobacter anseongensis TaxID=3133439 RepID=UPI0030A8F429